MIPNSYAKPVPVGIEVRADMLEITAGWPNVGTVDRELAFAVDALDTEDPATLHWLACCVAAKLDYMQSE